MCVCGISSLDMFVTDADALLLMISAMVMVATAAWNTNLADGRFTSTLCACVSERVGVSGCLEHIAVIATNPRVIKVLFSRVESLIQIQN